MTVILFGHLECQVKEKSIFKNLLKKQNIGVSVLKNSVDDYF